MQLSKGVEWAAHACTILALVPEGKGLGSDRLAAYFEVPAAYLAKQLQALRKTGIVESVRGQGGGYRLARGPEDITLLDIVTAIEGPTRAFRCTEIRQNGPCAVPRDQCKRPCEVAAAFGKAEQEFRSALARQSLASIMMEAAINSDPEHLTDTASWVTENC